MTDWNRISAEIDKKAFRLYLFVIVLGLIGINIVVLFVAQLIDKS